MARSQGHVAATSAQGSGLYEGHFGKWHLSGGGIDDAPLPAAYGFDDAAVWTGPGKSVFEGATVAGKAGTAHDRLGASYLTEAAVEHSSRFIRSAKGKPFFVNLWIHETHHLVSATDGEEKVSGLFFGELSSEKMPSWEDQNVQTKR